MIVPLDKPGGMTSAACVRRLGRAAGVRAGHAGTLDPGATGLLVVCMGESRKLSGLVMEHDKSYRATVSLGTATDTLDAWGVCTGTEPVPPIDEESVREVACRFTGRITQSVPVFSAVKRDGRPLHRQARRGAHVVPPEREVVVHEIRVLGVGEKVIDLEVTCGAGTYIRSLARDLADALGTVGHVSALRRLSCGTIRVDDALPLEEAIDAARDGTLRDSAVIHSRALEGRHLFLAGEPEVGPLRGGRPVGLCDLVELSPGSPPPVVLDPAGRAVCVGRVRGDVLCPRRVLLEENSGSG